MKSWNWLVYPVCVGLFILITTTVVLTNPQKWEELNVNQQSNQQLEDKIKILRAKLGVLQAFNKDQGERDLQTLLNYVPENKAAWSLLLELKSAASVSGIVVTGFKGQVGTVNPASGSANVNEGTSGPILTVTADVPDIVRLHRFLKQMMEQYPLVKIQSISLSNGVMQLVMEGAWMPMNKEVVSDEVLPDYTTDFTTLMSNMRTYLPALTEEESSSSSGFGVTNPF